MWSMQVCNTGAAPADGRAPKLIFQLGAAGTGKSTRMADCYEAMGVAKETMVVADGDHVREAHQVSPPSSISLFVRVFWCCFRELVKL